MARPKKQNEERRPHVVSFRLTGTQMDRLRSRAASAGLEPNDYARLQATGTASRVRRLPASEPPGLFELRQQLIRVGVNMNQIARRFNMTDRLEPDELRETCRDLDEIFRRILDGETFP